MKSKVTKINEQSTENALQHIRDLKPDAVAAVVFVDGELFCVTAGNLERHLIVGGLEQVKLDLLWEED